MGLVLEYGKQGQAVQQLISQTQATSGVTPVEQNLSSNSANRSVLDLPHSAGADKDIINIRTNFEGNHVIHNMQNHNISIHTSSVGSPFSSTTQGVNFGATNHNAINSQSVTYCNPSNQTSINSVPQRNTTGSHIHLYNRRNNQGYIIQLVVCIVCL